MGEMLNVKKTRDEAYCGMVACKKINRVISYYLL